MRNSYQSKNLATPKTRAVIFLGGLLLSLASGKGEAKIRVEQLKDLNFLTEPKEAYLNPEHGVFFVESGLLENLGQLELDGIEDQATLKAGELIRALFHSLPSGYVPSSGSAHLAFFLRPQLLGKILGHYHQGGKKAEGYIELILQDKGFRNDLEHNRRQSCALDLLIKDFEGGKGGKARREEMASLKKERKFLQIFVGDEQFCGKDLSLEAYLPPRLEEASTIEKTDASEKPSAMPELRLFSNLQEIASILAESSNNLLIARVLLGLLWYKVNNKEDFDDYLSGLSSQFEHLNTKKKDGWQKALWQEDDFKSISADDLPKRIYQMLLDHKGQTLLRQEHVYVDHKSWSDCGESSLRDFLRLFSEGEVVEGQLRYHLDLLRNLGANKEVSAFFTQYNTHDSQLSQAARNAWGLLTCDLAEVSYLKSFGKSRCELNAGADNMLKALKQLFSGSKDAFKDWQSLGKKMNEINKDFILGDVKLDGRQRGEISFTIREQEYIWYFQPSHFYIERDVPSLVQRFNGDSFKEQAKDPSFSKHLSAWGLRENHSFLNFLELAALGVGFLTRGNNLILDVRKEQGLKHLVFLLNLKSDEKVIDVGRAILEEETLLLQSLARKLLWNQDAQRRFVTEAVYTSSKKASLALAIFKKIENLELQSLRVEMIIALAPVVRELTDLQTLILSNTRLGGAGAKALAPALGELRGLQTLSLSSTRLGEGGITVLAPALATLRKLKALDLSYNKLGETGAAALAPALQQLRALETLELSSSDLGDGGIRKLVPALGALRELQTLDLASCGLGDDGARAIEDVLRGLKNLQTLRLGGNPISPKTLSDLKQIRQSLKIKEY